MIAVNSTIGDSQAAAAIGVSRWKSQMELWLEKTGRKPKGEIPENLSKFGNIMEEVIAKEFSQETGLRVRRVSKMYQHPEHEFMIGFIDRKVVGENAFLECKNTSEWASNEWKDDNVPLEYWIQCQHYMAIGNFDYCYIATVIGGNRFFYKRIERDNEFIAKLIELEKKFYEMVINDTPPDARDFKDAQLFVEHYYQPTDTVVEIEGLEPLIKDIIEMKAQVKELQEEIKKREVQIKEMMEEASVAIIGDYEVVWKPQVSKRLDTRRLKKENPEIYQKYVKETTSRVFRIKERRD